MKALSYVFFNFSDPTLEPVGVNVEVKPPAASALEQEEDDDDRPYYEHD